MRRSVLISVYMVAEATLRLCKRRGELAGVGYMYARGIVTGRKFRVTCHICPGITREFIQNLDEDTKVN